MVGCRDETRRTEPLAFEGVANRLRYLESNTKSTGVWPSLSRFAVYPEIVQAIHSQRHAPRLTFRFSALRGGYNKCSIIILSAVPVVDLWPRLLTKTHRNALRCSVRNSTERSHRGINGSVIRCVITGHPTGENKQAPVYRRMLFMRINEGDAGGLLGANDSFLEMVYPSIQQSSISTSLFPPSLTLSLRPYIHLPNCRWFIFLDYKYKMYINLQLQSKSLYGFSADIATITAFPDPRFHVLHY